MGGSEKSSGDYWGSNTASSSQSNQLSRPVQRHLGRVYGTLAGVSASAAAGSYAYVTDMISWNPQTASIMGMLLFVGVLFTRNPRPDPNTQMMRLGALLLFGLLQGISIGPLVDGLLDLNAWIIPQAIIATLLIFGSFTVSAFTSQRRSWIYTGGMLMSALSMLFWMSLLNMFFRSSTVFSVELYLGLLVFAGFVAFDTQMIVERAELGDGDYVSHGADLFTDLFGLLVRIMVILGRKEERDNNDGNRRRSRRK